MRTSILPNIRAERLDLNKHIGTELTGVKLSELDEKGIRDLKNLAAERGVLFFRNQRMSLADQVEIGRRLGELHVHPVTKVLAGEQEAYPEVIKIHADANSNFINGEGWHSDVSCEERPPALSMLRIETIPKIGGDTLWSSMYSAYDTLSESMKSYLLNLEAVHTGQVYRHKYITNGNEQQLPSSVHPVIRTHPVTGRKALFVNSGFTERIVGLKKNESDVLLHMLYDHISYGITYQVRFHWEEQSVAIWDNRCTQHHASWDYFPDTRNGYRVTTIGERPYQ